MQTNNDLSSRLDIEAFSKEFKASLCSLDPAFVCHSQAAALEIFLDDISCLYDRVFAVIEDQEIVVISDIARADLRRLMIERIQKRNLV